MGEPPAWARGEGGSSDSTPDGAWPEPTPYNGRSTGSGASDSRKASGFRKVGGSQTGASEGWPDAVPRRRNAGEARQDASLEERIGASQPEVSRDERDGAGQAEVSRDERVGASRPQVSRGERGGAGQPEVSRDERGGASRSEVSGDERAGDRRQDISRDRHAEEHQSVSSDPRTGGWQEGGFPAGASGEGNDGYSGAGRRGGSARGGWPGGGAGGLFGETSGRGPDESEDGPDEGRRGGRGRRRAGGARRGTGRARSAGWADGPQEGSVAGSGPEADPESVARAICLRLLTMAPKTRAQLAEAMRKRDVPREAAEAVLDRFTELGLINDEAFAEAWVDSRHHGRGLARRALAAELRHRGVDSDTVNEAVERVDTDQEAETARRLVERKLASTRGLDPQARTRRLAGMLARKGYGAGVAYRVVREALENEGVAVEDDFPEA
ncbi:recombination regulator RecX [Nonomuraea sp. bgisy101]|uniref:recombination regulator RecX n=1 Tax=Nonomuraea sp. bgisy101 TaxID=3413784 RepID=UPI003D713D04